MSSPARTWSEIAVCRDGTHHLLLLDRRPLRLPGGAELRLCTPGLAEAVCAEWRVAGPSPCADSLPLTALAGAAQLRVMPAPGAVADALAAYAADDLLCYRAPATLPLGAEQALEWDPWLRWAASAIPARLVASEGVVPVRQNAASLAACRAALTPLSPETLAGLDAAVMALGSFVLGLALQRGGIGAAEAARLATLEERAQITRWGEDVELSSRIGHCVKAVATASRFLDLAAEGERSCKQSG